MRETFLVKTLGCKVNQAEGESIREQLLERGYHETSNEEEAGLVVVNTCTVTAKADRESRNFIRHSKRLNPNARIIVTGCYAEKDQGAISKIDGVELIVPQNEKSVLVDRLFQGCGSGTSLMNISRFPNFPIETFSSHRRAFLKIQDGCNRVCSYCKVRIVRGPSKSRPIEEALSEARNLVAKGHREIVLTGIELGSYGKDLEPRTTLVDFIKELLKIPGLLRVRLSSIEPQEISQELIDLMLHEERLAKHLHIPLQSGSDAVLKRMRRGYTAQFYESLLQRIQAAMPDLYLSLDAIVGFPGETERDFTETERLIEKLRPVKTHIFPFSPREGTPACEMEGAVPSKEKARRAKALLNTAVRIAGERMKDFLGRELKVLIETFNTESLSYEGHTTHYLPVTLKSGKTLINREVDFLVESIEFYDEPALSGIITAQ